MPTVFLSPIGNGFNFLNGVGSLPLAAGKINTYLAGTSTPQATYTTSAGSVANANPVILDAAGRPVDSGNPVEIWLVQGLAYKFILTDSLNNTIATYDNLSGINDTSAAVINFLQAGAGAVTRTVQNKLRDTVSVKDFGAVGDGIANDTTAVQAALNSGAASVLFPYGSYQLDALTVPTSVHSIQGNGPGGTTLICHGVTANVWIALNASLQGCVISDLTINQNKATFVAATAIYCDTAAFVTIENLVFNDAGRLAIITYGTDTTIRNNTFVSFAQTAIAVDLGAQRVSIENNRVLVAGTGHGISVAATGAGGHHLINNNYVFRAGAASFCISITAPDTIVSNNRCQTNTLEGINVQDVSLVSVTDNIITCESGHSDFAISLFASTAAVQQCVVAGNRVYNSGKAGIGLASATGGASFCRYNHVVGNLVSSPIQLGAGVTSLARGGIILYGPNTSANTVQANRILDEANNMLYGVVEWNDGSGNPGTNNLLDNNVLTKGAGFLSEAHILSTNTRAWFTDFESYTPTITSGTGTLTTTVVNAAKFKPRGKQVHLRLDITITTNGTGATNIQATLPVGYNAVSGGGVINGKESVLTGSAITGDCSSTTCTILTYNNTYPGGSTARLILDGFYEAA